MTEYGLQTAINKWEAHPFTDRVKAKYLIRSMTAMFARPEIKRGFIYQLADTSSNPKLDDPQAHFGLLRNDISPTMAYHAVRNVMHLLCDAAAALNPRRLKASPLSGDLQSIRSILLQKGSDVFYLLLWQEVASYEKPKPSNLLQSREWTAGPRPLALTFDEPVAAVRTYLPSALDGDADEGKRPKATFERPTSLGLEVPDELLIVEIIPDGATQTGDTHRMHLHSRHSLKTRFVQGVPAIEHSEDVARAALSVDQRRRAPQALERVKLANLGTEQVHQHVAGVDQHPVAMTSAFDGNGARSEFLHLFNNMIGHRRDLPLRGPGSDYHVVRDAGLTCKIDDDHVVGFVAVQRSLDRLEHVVGRGRCLHHRRYGGCLLSVLILGDYHFRTRDLCDCRRLACAYTRCRTGMRARVQKKPSGRRHGRN